MEKIIIILFFIVMNINNIKGQELLPGKIVVYDNDKLYTYYNGIIYEYALPNSKERNYSGLGWMNKKDILIGNELVTTKDGRALCTNLVMIDTSGNIIERVIDVQEGQFIGLAFPSATDKILLFQSTVKSKEGGDFEFFNRLATINIMDFESKEIIKKIENFCLSTSFTLDESPWSPDETSFVYSISGDGPLLALEGAPEKTYPGPEKGIYIYNIANDSHTKISDGGKQAAWSPKGDKIVFEKDKKIWLYNTLENSVELFYAAGKSEFLKEIHWTPDGDYLFVVCPKYKNRYEGKYNEKLIRIKDKKEVEYKKLNIGNRPFTWKG